MYNLDLVHFSWAVKQEGNSLDMYLFKGSHDREYYLLIVEIPVTS
jgi:hypothetical protein